MARTVPKPVILVISHQGSPWLAECLASLDGVAYPVEVVDGGSTFDPMGFYYAQTHNLSEFVILHDSCVVKDLALFDMLFKRAGHVSLSPGFMMCMGKFVQKDLPDLPAQPQTKRQAVEFESAYCSTIQGECLFPDFVDSQQYEEKHGRTNMKLENDYLIKYKGFWSFKQVAEVYEQDNRRPL